MSRREKTQEEKLAVKERVKHHDLSGDVKYNQARVRHRGQRLRVATIVRGDSLTRQADEKQANIHNIINRYRQTGQLPSQVAQPLEGDLIGTDDFMSAMNIVVTARENFEQLPVKIRERFGHDPGNFLRYMQDKENHPEAIQLGLLKAPEEPNPAPVAAPIEPAKGAGGGAAAQ